MNIEWVIPCRYAEIHDNLGTIVGAGIDTFWLPELPIVLQVVMAVRLTAVADELGVDQPHPLRHIIRGPQGETISDAGGEVRAEGESARADWLTGIMLHTVMQFEATEEGTYAFELTVDQSTVSVPLHVVHGPPPTASP